MPFTADGPYGDSTVPGGVGTPTTGGGGGDIFSSLINLGSSIYTMESEKNMAAKNRKAAKDMAEYQYSKELEMWNKNNDYNDPASQMLRLKNAGLNPVFGGSGAGSAAAGNAAPSSMPRYNAPTLSYNYTPMNIPGVISAYQDFQVKQAQVDNLKAQEQNTRARTVSEANRNILLGVQGKAVEQKVGQSESMFPYQLESLKHTTTQQATKVGEEWQKLALLNQQELSRNLEMEYTRKKMSNMDIDSEKKMTELVFNQYRNDWMKMGITSSDNVLLRTLTRMLNESGLSPAAFFDRSDASRRDVQEPAKWSFR